MDSLNVAFVQAAFDFAASGRSRGGGGGGVCSEEVSVICPWSNVYDSNDCDGLNVINVFELISF